MSGPRIRRARPSPRCRCSRSPRSARRRRAPLPRDAERPLSGIRVLDLTRVIAGPVCGRALAAHGADVMRITAPHLPGLPELDIDTGRGKLSAASTCAPPTSASGWPRCCARRTCSCRAIGRAALAASRLLARGLAEMRPGIVAVSLSAYGHAGPWADRRGFDSLVQNASGINHAEAEAAGVAGPKELPAQALDHATRLPDGVRRHDGAAAQGARGRLLARARVARADRPLADGPRPPRARL